MALNLFKRVDSVKGLFAVESISLIYNALTTIMVLILFPRMDHVVLAQLAVAGRQPDRHLRILGIGHPNMGSGKSKTS